MKTTDYRSEEFQIGDSRPCLKPEFLFQRLSFPTGTVLTVQNVLMAQSFFSLPYQHPLICTQFSL